MLLWKYCHDRLPVSINLKKVVEGVRRICQRCNNNFIEYGTHSKASQKLWGCYGTQWDKHQISQNSGTRMNWRKCWWFSMEQMETWFCNKKHSIWQQIMGRTQDWNICHIYDTNIFLVKNSSKDGPNQCSHERNEAWEPPLHATRWILGKTTVGGTFWNYREIPTLTFAYQENYTLSSF